MTHRTRQGQFLRFQRPTSGRGPARVGGATSVVLDGRALIMHGDSKQLFELDEATTAWWLLFDGTPLSALARDVSAAFEMPEDKALNVGRAAAAELHKCGILSMGQGDD